MGYRWHKGALGVPRGCMGALGVASGLEANHIGPQSGVPALPLVPLGE